MEQLRDFNAEYGHTSQVKYRPENTNEFSFLALGRVCQHQGTLGSPKETRTDAKNCTSGDDKPAHVGVNVHGTK